MSATQEIAGVFAVGMQVFRAIKLDEDGSLKKYAYKLIGPDNQEYHLMRVNGQPHLMVALDMRRRIQPPNFKGIVFSDVDNALQIAQAR